MRRSCVPCALLKSSEHSGLEDIEFQPNLITTHAKATVFNSGQMVLHFCCHADSQHKSRTNAQTYETYVMKLQHLDNPTAYTVKHRRQGSLSNSTFPVFPCSNA